MRTGRSSTCRTAGRAFRRWWPRSCSGRSSPPRATARAWGSISPASCAGRTRPRWNTWRCRGAAVASGFAWPGRIHCCPREKQGLCCNVLRGGKRERMNDQRSALIVDDERDIRELLVLTLGRMGLRTETASSLNEARALLATHRFDLCLTDMRLPDGSGIDLIGEITQQYPNT